MNPRSSSQPLEGDSRRSAPAVTQSQGWTSRSGVRVPAKASAHLMR